MAEFYKCSKCGKILIEKLTSGVWVFRFGEQLCIGENQRVLLESRIVEIQLIGILRMRCTRRSCRRRHPKHWNDFNVFELNQMETSDSQSNSGSGLTNDCKTKEATTWQDQQL